MSEPAGEFARPDNLVSNETHFAEMVRLLRPRGGVYIGVGPEQNFSYIAEIQPAMAFVVDIRRANRDLHLFYKALFELVGRPRGLRGPSLFAPGNAPQIDAGSSVEDLFAASARFRRQIRCSTTRTSRWFIIDWRITIAFLYRPRTWTRLTGRSRRFIPTARDPLRQTASRL